MKKFFIIVFILLFYYSGYSQFVIQAVVKDSKTKTPLEFCNVWVKDTTIGTITNRDGIFRIRVKDIKNDILVFSYMGYELLEVSAENIRNNKEVLLSPKNNVLSEVIVDSDNDYLYDILINCKKKIENNNAKKISKVYYGVDSKINGYPVELLELYYNGSIDGINVNDLILKNGRVGMNPYDNFFFLTLHTSMIMSKISIIESDSNIPYSPLHYNKRKMKKNYNLKMMTRGDKFFHINFEPYNNHAFQFSGEIWIDKETYDIIQINLKVVNSSHYPFSPIYKSDKISDINMNISNKYKLVANEVVPDFLNISYSFNYHSIRDSVIGASENVKVRNISSESIMYFYDYEEPFINPYFKYNQKWNDYIKLSAIPYNQTFWDNNNVLLLTNDQKKSLDFFTRDGYVYNYGRDNSETDFYNTISTKNDTLEVLLKSHYKLWSREKRLSIEQDARYRHDLNIVDAKIKNIPPKYKFETQILLDIIEVGDSFYTTSYTVFDLENSYFNLEKDIYSDVILNIYFDIYEIERLKMENKIKNSSDNLDQIVEIYNETIKNIDKITKEYLYEVYSSLSVEILTKWNNYVIKNLGIDNMALIEKEE